MCQAWVGSSVGAGRAEAASHPVAAPPPPGGTLAPPHRRPQHPPAPTPPGTAPPHTQGACARRPASQFTAAPRSDHTCVASHPPRRCDTIERSTSHSSESGGKPLVDNQNHLWSGNAVEPVRWAGRRSGGGPARLSAGARAEHVELRREPAGLQPDVQSPGLRAAARRPRQEIPEHDGVRAGAFLGARRRDRRQTR